MLIDIFIIFIFCFKAQGAEMLEFLNNWRDEQVKKIETELKRLNSIENFIAQRNKTLNTNKG